MALGVLAASIFLQLMAAGLVLRLIVVTGWRFAWTFVSAALILMSLPRCITLYREMFGEGSPAPDLGGELTALMVSVLMVTGIALIGPMLARAKRAERTLRRGEAEVRKLNEELMNRVDERTAELHATRESLNRNQSLAALGEMTGSVAHDLRNPLGAISHASQLLSESKNLDRGDERLEKKRSDDGTGCSTSTNIPHPLQRGTCLHFALSRGDIKLPPSKGDRGA